MSPGDSNPNYLEWSINDETGYLIIPRGINHKQIRNVAFRNKRKEELDFALIAKIAI